MKPNPEPPPCWGGLLICIWPVAVIFSILVQCFITAWRVNHRRRPRSRRHAHRSTRSNSRPRETREEARQRKYRYLYQVRTARGDIISQVNFRFEFLRRNLRHQTNSELCVISLELCVGAAEACPTRLRTSIRTLNKNQFARTEYAEQWSNTLHKYSSRLGSRQDGSERWPASPSRLRVIQFIRTWWPMWFQIYPLYILANINRLPLWIRNLFLCLFSILYARVYNMYLLNFELLILHINYNCLICSMRFK